MHPFVSFSKTVLSFGISSVHIAQQQRALYDSLSPLLSTCYMHFEVGFVESNFNSPNPCARFYD